MLRTLNQKYDQNKGLQFEDQQQNIVQKSISNTGTDWVLVYNYFKNLGNNKEEAISALISIREEKDTIFDDIIFNKIKSDYLSDKSSKENIQILIRLLLKSKEENNLRTNTKFTLRTLNQKYDQNKGLQFEDQQQNIVQKSISNTGTDWVLVYNYFKNLGNNKEEAISALISIREEKDTIFDDIIFNKIKSDYLSDKSSKENIQILIRLLLKSKEENNLRTNTKFTLRTLNQKYDQNKGLQFEDQQQNIVQKSISNTGTDWVLVYNYFKNLGNNKEEAISALISIIEEKDTIFDDIIFNKIKSDYLSDKSSKENIQILIRLLLKSKEENNLRT